MSSMTKIKSPPPAVTQDAYHGALFQHSVIGIGLFSEDSILKKTNVALALLLGASEQELVDKPIHTRIAQHHLLSWTESVRNVMSGRIDRLELDIAFCLPDKRQVLALVIGSRFNGHLLCHFVDITSRKEIEITLRQTERRFRDVAEATYDQFWETDDTFCFTYVYDPRNVSSFPGPSAQLGKRRWEIDGFEPFEHAGLSEHIDDLLNHRAFRDFRFSVIDPSGMKYYWRSSGRPMHDEQGRFCGYRGISTNITGRTRAERALQQSESRFRAIADHSPIQIHIRDTEGRYVLWNQEAAKFFGVPESAVLGRRASEFLCPEIAKTLTANDAAVLASHESIEQEEQITIRENTYTFLTTKFPIRGEHQQITGIGSIGTDISERKRNEQTLRESQDNIQKHASELARIQRTATISEMTAAFAHQINQPINAVANYTSVCLHHLNRSDWNKEDFRKILELTRDQALGAGRLVREIGDFIRYAKPQIIPCDLNEILRCVATLMEHEFRRAHIRLILEFDTNLPFVPMEKIEIEQVILNLLVNAMEAMRALPSGQRRVIASTMLTQSREVMLTVHDSGPGICETMWDKMFEPFSSNKPDGLGIGLAISRSIITRHHGRLWAEKSSPEGAIFRFTLPVETDDAN